jgi:signal transduction histidine kinase
LSGGFVVVRQPTDFKALLERIVAEAQATAPQRRIVLEVAGNLTGDWEEGRLGQLVANLLTNAIRHGAAGAISVQASGAESDHVTLSVHNAGTIPPNVRERLFDPFRSGGDPLTRSGGLGLGLFIVKQIVEAHGGRIGVSSSDADGTRFEVRLPRQGR